MRRSGILLAILIELASGCAPPAAVGGFESDNPASKLYAIHRAGAQRDRSAVPDLVEQLESDDPVVRMMSIAALERITGQRLGYNPYAPPAERRAAVEAWVDAVRKGKFAASR